MEWQETAQKWKEFENLEPTLKAQLANMDEATLKDAFYAPLEFGTAGMRGILEPGINRMNIYTIRQATEGLARLIEDYGPEAKRRGVAISFDTRHFSSDFAREAARVLATHQITSYVFESFRPTPELSFAVRHLHTFAGIMITASHNPSKYNGYKVYGEDGGQMPPKDAETLTRYVRSVENPLEISVLSEEELTKTDYVHIIGREVDQAYLEQVKLVTINPTLLNGNEELKVVYTPLHGTGLMLTEKTLEQAGFKGLHVVKEQAIPDGDFTTVQSPNPEEPSAFLYSMKLGQEIGAELLIATDPDADRLGAAVRLPNGEYQVITGNQIASILVDYILYARQKANDLPSNAAILKSIVSSELPSVIAHSYGVEAFDVLTGFKFIAEKIQQYEETGKHTFVFGFEESYGFLVKSFVRDKDAIQAVLLLTEVAAYYQKSGKNLYDALQDLYQKYGYFIENTISVTIPGIEGSEKIKKIMGNLRQQAPTTLGHLKIVKVQDFQLSTQQVIGQPDERLDYPKSNVLKYFLEDGSWVAVRPSGTEPKIKFYIGVTAPTKEAAQVTLEKITVDLEKYKEL